MLFHSFILLVPPASIFTIYILMFPSSPKILYCIHSFAGAIREYLDTFQYYKYFPGVLLFSWSIYSFIHCFALHRRIQVFIHCAHLKVHKNTLWNLSFIDSFDALFAHWLQKVSKALCLSMKVKGVSRLCRMLKIIGPRAFWSTRKSHWKWLIKSVVYWYFPGHFRNMAPKISKKH